MDETTNTSRRRTRRIVEERQIEGPGSADEKDVAGAVQSKIEPEVSEKGGPAGTEDSKRAAAARKRKKYLRQFRNLLIRFASFLLIIYVLFFHIVGLTLMPREDMTPRIDAGDLLLYYRLESEFRAQDVIVFRKQMPDESGAAVSGTVTLADRIVGAGKWVDRQIRTLFHRPIPEGELFVARVVAAAGDTVEITDDERLLVNGNSMIETNIFYSTPRYEGEVEYPLVLGEDEVFVLADKRNNGVDSRFFGPVHKGDILGTVITILRRNNL